jgi:hypothetical protein
MRQMYRRLRWGQPIVIVSGLPRSGTSMMMRMLEAGGVPLMTDEVRGPDESNPRGYCELTAVKELGTSADRRWLSAARGKALKVVSPLVEHLPPTCNYQVLFMVRDLDEVIASQNRMLALAGEPVAASANLREQYRSHVQRVLRLIDRRSGFVALQVDYADVLRRPLDEATRVQAFLNRLLDVPAMAAAVDEELYRNRKEPGANS